MLACCSKCRNGSNCNLVAQLFDGAGVVHAISRLSRPHIAFLDGIVMGGGAGVSMNGRFQIATERCACHALPCTVCSGRLHQMVLGFE